MRIAMIFKWAEFPKPTLFRFTLCSVLCLVAAFAVLFSRHCGLREWVMPLRIVASSSFIAAALAAGLPKDRYGWGVLVFLAFCWLGDIFGPLNFLVGVFFFLVAHVAIAVAIWLHGVQWRRFRYAAVLLFVLNSAIYLSFVSQMQSGERLWILAYTIVIGLMVASAAAIDAPAIRALTLTAALLFWVSDIELGLTKYTDAGFIFTVTGYPIYYTSCLIFALSAVRSTSEARLNN